MSDKTYPSSVDWKEASGKQSLSSIISTRIKTVRPTSTITYTDYVTSTITASNYEPTASNNGYEPTTYAEDVWEHRIHRFLPVILAFAIIGILTVLGCLVYLAFRFYQANRSSRRRRRRRRDAEEATNFEDENNKKANAGSPISTTLSNIIPWLAIPSPLHPNDQDGTYVDYQQQQREPIRYEKSDLNRIMMEDSDSTTRRPSLAPSWLAKIFPNKFNNNNTERPQQKQRHLSLPILGERPTIDNLNVPISSTFKPIDNSFLTLVPRSEIWLDPNRRRGVDELDIWERKKSGTVVAVEEPSQPAPLMWRFPSETAYPSSPESFERRISAIVSGGLTHSRPSSITTMQETSDPYQASTSRHKSEFTRHVQDNDDILNDSTIASSSINYHNALQYHQEEEEDENEQHFSKFAITVKLPKSQYRRQLEAEGSSQNDVRFTRQVLEASRLKNSSSQWLHCTGSRSF